MARGIRQAGYFSRLVSPVPVAAPMLSPVARPVAAASVAPLEVFAPTPVPILPARGATPASVPPPRAVPPVTAPEAAGHAEANSRSPVLAPAVLPRTAGAASQPPATAPDNAPAPPSQASPVPQARTAAPRATPPHMATPHPAPPSAAPAWPDTPRPVLLPVNAGRAVSPPSPQSASPPARSGESLAAPDTSLPPEATVAAPAAIAQAIAPVLAPVPPPRPAAEMLPQQPPQRLTATALQPAVTEPTPFTMPRPQPAVPGAPSIHIGVVEVRAAPPPQVIAPRPARPASARSASLSRGYGPRFGFGQS